MTVLACYSVWQDDERLGVSMRSVQPVVDRYVIVDGRYEGFFKDRPVGSTDHTLEIAHRFPSVKTIPLTEALRPVQKRNLYLKESADWYLIMDADEILYGDLKRLRNLLEPKSKVLAYNIPTFLRLSDLAVGKAHTYCRLVHKNAGFHYSRYHWIRLNSDGKTIEEKAQTLDFVKVLALNELIPQERQTEKIRWSIYRSNRGEGW